MRTFKGLMEKSKAMAPMTKEEWEKRQSVVRKVLDEESGRYRLFYQSIKIYIQFYSNAVETIRNFVFYCSIFVCSALSLDFRLIKGDGEVLEEIVTQKRHKDINKHATKSDGEFFQTVISKGTR